MNRTIVVGAGAAGAVVASRLSAASKEEVVLLEAGPDYPDVDALPKDLVDGTRNSMKRHDWGYSHRPMRDGFRMPFPRGRVVGGSSAVNTCIALRGEPYDYDEWGATGLPEWSMEACMPAFTRLETDLDFPEKPYHGSRGPIRIRRHTRDELGTFQAAFLDAAESVGYSACEDTNAPGSTGFGPHAMNKVAGVRQSAARGYLDAKTRARPNLEIVSRAYARRLVVERGRVVGVVAIVDGETRTYRGDRVVVACGAIETPRLLLASGIGPREELARHGVALVHELRGVGTTLLDHPGLAVFLLPKAGVVSKHDPLIQNVLRYTPARGRRNEMQIQPGSFVPLHVDLPIVSLMVSVGKPASRAGELTFLTLDPGGPLRIDNHFLEHDDDADKAIESVERIAELADAPAIRGLARPLVPGRAGLRSREAIRRWLGRQVGSGYHPCGTAKMGAADDPLAVTDGRGRVHGLDGLVIADASLMPTVPTANTHLPTLMVAERIAEFLIGD